MAYCKATEIRKMLKDDALNSIIGDSYIEEDERERRIIPIIKAAIEDADAEIDGYLAKRYPLPLQRIPKVIAKFSKDMAVYNLYSRRGIDESSEEKNYLNRYRAAIDFLKSVAEGKVDIGVDTSQTVAKTGFSVKSNNRRFSRDSLKGM